MRNLLTVITYAVIIASHMTCVCAKSVLSGEYDLDEIKKIYVSYMKGNHPNVLVDENRIYIKQFEPYILISPNDCVYKVEKLKNGMSRVVTCLGAGGYELEIDNKDLHVIRENVYK